MRGKILYSDWNPKTGEAYVRKATPYGTFAATTMVHPDDKDIATSWDGFHFCVVKCDIQALREKAKRMRQRAIGIENALKALDNTPGLDPYTLDKLERQMWAAYKEAEKCKNIYEEMRDAYSAYTDIILKRRRELRKKVANLNSED